MNSKNQINTELQSRLAALKAKEVVKNMLIEGNLELIDFNEKIIGTHQRLNLADKDKEIAKAQASIDQLILKIEAIKSEYQTEYEALKESLSLEQI